MAAERFESFLTKIYKYLPGSPPPIKKITLEELTIARKHAKNLASLFVGTELDERADLVAASREHLIQLRKQHFPLLYVAKNPLVTVSENPLAVVTDRRTLIALCALVSSYLAANTSLEGRSNGEFVAVLLVNFMLLYIFLTQLAPATSSIWQGAREMFKDGVKEGMSNMTTSCTHILTGVSAALFSTQKAPFVIIDLTPLLDCKLNTADGTQLLQIYKDIYSSDLLQLDCNQDCIKLN